MGKIMEAVFILGSRIVGRSKKNKEMLWFGIMCLILVAALGACGKAQDSPPLPAHKVTENAKLPRKISAEEANGIMNSGEEYFLLDVRTQEEFDSQHIPGAVCIPDTELTARKAELPQEPDSLILVYCRSGRRSAASAQVLAEMGYTAVCDFGGIIDWPYETISAEVAAVTADNASHTHQWEDFDCNYQQCTVCGAQKRYSDPA